MLSINQILNIKPVFILAVDYASGSLADMLGEHDRDDNSANEYLAEMTIQYHSLTNNACLAFYVECLVSVNDDNIVTIEEMNTCQDSQSVYAHNIAELISFSGNSVNLWGNDICDTMQSYLAELIESQPIYDIPKHFTIESY